MKKYLFLYTLTLSINAIALTEKELVNSVLNHFPLIEESIMKYKAADAEVTSAEGAFDHKLSFKSRNRIEDKYDNQYFETTIERTTPYYGLGLIAGHRQGRGTFPPYDGKYETSAMGEVFAGITLPLLRNFSTDEARTSLAIAKIEKKQAHAQIQLKKNIYIHKSLSLFYKWLLENQKIKIRKEILALALNRHSMLEKKFKAGDIERLKINDNQRSIDKRKDEIIKSEINIARIKAELSLYFRDEDGNPVTIKESTYPDENKISESQNFSSINLSVIPQFSILELEKNKLKTLKELYAQSRRPGLSVEILGAKELSGNAAYDPDSLQLGLKFDYPLENRKAKGKTVSSEYKLKAIQKESDYLAQELTRMFNFSIEAMHASRKRWNIISRELKNALTMGSAEVKRWDQGASDLFIVYLREQEIAETNIRRWTALYEFLQFSLDAKLYSGTLIQTYQTQ
jgi:cobalt-zinc-cadmium efflux system outer membrane protein